MVVALGLFFSAAIHPRLNPIVRKQRRTISWENHTWKYAIDSVGYVSRYISKTVLPLRGKIEGPF